MSYFAKLLIVDSNPDFLKQIESELQDNYEVKIASTGKDAVALFDTFGPQAVILDADLADMSFVHLIERFRRTDVNVIRMITSSDFSNIEHIIEAINVAHVHNYFRKPVNYMELKNALQGKLGDYAVVKGYKAVNERTEMAYHKLHTILDKVADSKSLEQQSKEQLAKVGSIERDSLRKIEESFSKVRKANETIQHLEAVVEELKDKSFELEELKKRDVDRVEKERSLLKEKLEQMEGEHAKMLAEKREIESSLKDIEFDIESSRDAAIQVDANFKAVARVQIDGKDSILAVDDETEITRSFAKLFKRKYNVHTASEPKEALKVLAEHPEICLIVSDQRMPGMTGIELASEVKKTKPDMPVLLLTGYTDINIAIEALNAGTISKYFEKPMDFDILSAAIKDHISLYDTDCAERELLKEKKLVVVDRLKELSKEVKELQFNNTQLSEDHESLVKKHGEIAQELAIKSDKIGQLEVAVVNERKKLLGEMKEERKRFNEEMVRKKAEAEQVVETQKQKNKAELDLLREGFAQEKANVQDEINKLKNQLEQDRQGMLAEVEAKRLELEVEQNKVKEKFAEEKKELEAQILAEREAALAEKGKLHQQMEEEKQQVLAALEQKRKEAEAERAKLQARFEQDREAMLGELERKQKEAEAEQAKLQEKLEAERVALEKKIADQQKKVDEDLANMKVKVAAEQKAIQEKFDAEMEAKKKEALAEYEKMKSDLKKKEEDITKVLKEAAQSIKDKDREIEGLLKDMTQLKKDRDVAVGEINEMKDDYDLLKASREALEGELAEYRG